MIKGHYLNKKGFTLIEVVIYVTYVAILSAVAINGVIDLTQVFGSFQITRDLNNTADIVTDRIVRQMRLAYDIDQGASNFGVNPGKLVLNTTDGTVNTTIEFYVLDGRIKVKESGVDKGYLGSKNVDVDILVFELITNGRSQAVRTRLELSVDRFGNSHTKTFYATTILRGGY